MSTEITINDTTIDINVTEYPITIEAPSGAYPLPTSVYSVFGRTGNVIAVDGDYNLTQLGDVTITGPLTGQVLRYNGTAWVNNTETYVGTVTNVAALTIGTTGTDLTSSVTNSTTTPVITLNVPTASATNRGALSSADWSTFNAKQPALNGTGFVKISGTTISYDNSTYYLASNPSSYIALTALSSTATGLTYTNTTGVFSTTAGYGIPTTAKQTTWDTAYNDSIVSAAVTGTTTKTLTLNQQDGGTVTASWSDLQPVTSVFGRTGAVVATTGDYTTTQVTEGTNLYYTDARARASNSFVAGSGAYNSTTGVITIPTNNNQLTNGAAFITLTSLSATSPLSYVNTTGVFSISQANTSTNGYLSSFDWNTFNNKQIALTFGNLTSSDITVTGGTGAVIGTGSTLTLATVNTNTGTFGSSTAIPVITVNGKGLITALTTTAVSIPSGSLSFIGDVTGTGTTGSDTTLTLATVNTNVGAYGSSTSVPTITVNAKGLVTAASQTAIPTATNSVTGLLTSTDWSTFNGKQNQLNGTGFVKIIGTTISYDNSTYLTTISGITAGGELSGTYANPSLVNSAVTGKVLTGVNITGGTIADTDSILTAFGKVQNQINGLIGGSIYKGTWNASTNTPTLTSSVGTAGNYYIVSVAGTTNLNGITDWQVGDWVIYQGTEWEKVDNTDAVVSVNGFTGAVSLTTSNISEGTNLYYTDTRARASNSAGTGISYNSTSGVITNSAPDQTVSLTASTGISTSGTYPSFTITNTAPDQTVALTSGTGISATGTYPNFTITNTAPDQTVALTQGGTTTISGTYPNFTISSADQYVGTVTSVGITESSAALSITGSPVVNSGNINIGFAGSASQYVAGDGSLVTFPSVISQASNLVTEVYNETGATLTKGTIVYINGGHGNLPTVAKALATADSTSAQTYGFINADLTNNNNGFVTVIGSLENMDTQAYANGTQLYLSGTTAGTYTSTKPQAPIHLVYVAVVVRSHPTQGVLEVRIQNGYELDELHDVQITSVANNNILQYNAATSLWKNVAGTTTNIAEGTNLYYTDTRARASLSFVAGSGAYNSTTGVITIPTNNTQITNGSNYITLTSLSSSATGLTYTNTTGAFSLTAGYVIPTTSNATNWDTAYTNRITSATSPLSITSNVISIAQATTSTNGYLSSTDWTTFNNKQATISLTTTGSSGAATLISNVLNVPTYTLTGLGGVPTTRTLTINGTGYDLSADRSWTIPTSVNATFTQDYTATAAQTTFTVTGGYTVGQLAVFYNGSKLAAAEFTATNGTTFVLATACQVNDIVQAVVSVTGGGIGGSGTTNYVSKFTASGVLGNSLIWDNGTNVGIGNTNTSYTLDVSGTVRGTTSAYFATSSGSVGIGTTNTNNVKLEVSATTIGGAEYSAFTTNQDGGVSSKYSFWRTYGGGSTAFRAGYVANYNQDDSNSSANDQRLVFATKSGTAEPTTKMTITGAGNVGIGQSSPRSLLEVLKTTSNTSLGVPSNASLLLSQGGNLNEYSQMLFGYTLNTSPAAIAYITTNAAAYTNGAITFATRDVTTDTAPTERMRITSGGDVSIGNTGIATVRLSVTGSGTSSSAYSFISYDSGGNVLLLVRNDGLISLGTRANSPYNNTTGSSANAIFASDGTLQRSTVSSLRYKENVNEWDENGLNTILALKPKTFTYKANYYKYPEVVMLGLIAEEVAEVSPYLADYENEDRSGQVENVRYANIVVPLIKAVQEQNQTIQELNERLNKAGL
jgi:hypothetical protein